MIDLGSNLFINLSVVFVQCFDRELMFNVRYLWQWAQLVRVNSRANLLSEIKLKRVLNWTVPLRQTSTLAELSSCCMRDAATYSKNLRLIMNSAQHRAAEKKGGRMSRTLRFEATAWQLKCNWALYYFIACMRNNAWWLQLVLCLHHICTLNQPSQAVISISAAFRADLSSLSNSVVSGSCISCLSQIHILFDKQLQTFFKCGSSTWPCVCRLRTHRAVIYLG